MRVPIREYLIFQFYWYEKWYAIPILGSQSTILLFLYVRVYGMAGVITFKFVGMLVCIIIDLPS